MEAGLSAFKNAFSERVKSNNKQNITKPPEKRSKARAVSKMTGAAAEMWQSLEKILPNSLQLAKPANCPGLMCDPCYLGVEAGNIACGGEPDYVASLRLVMEGTRTFIAAPISSMYEVFGAEEPSVYWKKFLDVSAEDVANLQATNCLFQVTCGKGEMRYLPYGWIFGEKVLDDQDVIGFTVRGLCRSDGERALSEVQLIRKLLVQHKKEEKNLPSIFEQTSKICSEIAAAALKSKAPVPEADATQEGADKEAAKEEEEEASPNGKGKGNNAGKGQAQAAA